MTRAQIAEALKLCPNCQGKGTELSESFRGVAFSTEEMHDDPDFFEAYMGGHYDVACRCCKGLRVVTATQLRAFRSSEADARERADELRMGY